MNNLSPIRLIKFTSQSWNFGLKSQMEFWLTFHLKFHTTIATFSYCVWEVPWWFLIYVTVRHNYKLKCASYISRNWYLIVLMLFQTYMLFLLLPWNTKGNVLNTFTHFSFLSASVELKKALLYIFGVWHHYEWSLYGKASQNFIDMSVSKWWQIVHFCSNYPSIKYMYRKQT